MKIYSKFIKFNKKLKWNKLFYRDLNKNEKFKDF